jgi:hypothetical protein
MLVALAVVAFLRPPAAPAGGETPPPTPTGRQPAFHLDATPEQRTDILESAFGKIASERADRLGALKDDIALLLDDPGAVRYVVAQWHARRSEGRYADAAFADLFRLVKRPEFVDPTAELLASPFPEIRLKALQSAETQADPRLGPGILAIYRGAAGEEGDRRLSVKLAALQAGFACGGDSLPALLAEALRDPNDEVAVRALTIASDLDVPDVAGEVKRLLGSARSPRVRLHAAALLARRGDLAAPADVVAALDPREPALAAEALHLVAKYRMAHAAARLREIRPAVPPDLRTLVTLALLRLDDSATWEEVIHAADAAGGEGELEALQLLGASGNAETAPILLHAIARGGLARVRAIAAGISTSREKGFLPVIERLVEEPVDHPSDLGDAPAVGGQALVPRLAALLENASEPAVQARHLAWLGMVGGNAARGVMLQARSRIPRLADEQIRLVDLEARRLGQAAPSLQLR